MILVPLDVHGPNSFSLKCFWETGPCCVIHPCSSSPLSSSPSYSKISSVVACRNTKCIISCTALALPRKELQDVYNREAPVRWL